jgi:hypothetical protein
MPSELKSKFPILNFRNFCFLFVFFVLFMVGNDHV